MANRRFSSQFLYQFEVMPVLLSCNFIVDSTNGNGFGVRSLKGNGINRVYMHTTQTPAAGSPNPESGVIMVQLQDGYSRYLGGFSGQVSPVSGTPLTSTTATDPYTIVSLGTTTLAQWQAAGLPKGVTPAVGASFIAIQTGAIGGTGAVEAPLVSGIDHIEVIGDPNATLSPVGQGLNQGGIIIMQCLNEGALTAPADGTTIGLNFYLSNSSITVKGQ